MNTQSINSPVRHLWKVLPVLAMVLAGCTGQMEKKPIVVSSSGGGGTDMTAYILDAEPANAVPVGEGRTTARPGETIVVEGRIAGKLSPFTEGYATFVLADDSLYFCDEDPDDACKTPWDACCEDPDKIKANRATVQILADDGRPIPASLKGVNGLTELDMVVVTGSVDASSTADNLIINASGIYRRAL